MLRLLLAALLLASPAVAQQVVETRPINPIVSTALESSHVLATAKGTLMGLSITSTTTAGMLLLFDATSAPADGAVTPIKCYQVPAAQTVGVSFAADPVKFDTGMVAVFSSVTTTCFSKTASATAFFSGSVK